jgi:hypothetical protein
LILLNLNVRAEARTFQNGTTPTVKMLYNCIGQPVSAATRQRLPMRDPVNLAEFA